MNDFSEKQNSFFLPQTCTGQVRVICSKPTLTRQSTSPRHTPATSQDQRLCDGGEQKISDYFILNTTTTLKAGYATHADLNYILFYLFLDWKNANSFYTQP